MSNRKNFWSRLGSPATLIIGACVACCAAPLVAILWGAGTAAAAAVITEGLEGVAIALALGVAVIAVIRRRRARAAAACASGDCRS